MQTAKIILKKYGAVSFESPDALEEFLSDRMEVCKGAIDETLVFNADGSIEFTEEISLLGKDFNLTYHVPARYVMAYITEQWDDNGGKWYSIETERNGLDFVTAVYQI